MTANNNPRDEIGFEELPLHMKQIIELSDNFQSDKYPKCRCFYLVDGKVVFGVNLLETGDSFLVGAPARMVRPTNDSDIEVDPLYDTSVIRMVKASVALVTLVQPKFRFLYLDYLNSNGVTILPDYMNEDRLAGTRELMNDINSSALGVASDRRPVETQFKGNTMGSGSVMVH